MNQLVLKKKNELTKNKKGFTLVELIIVIAIIAILAAIAIPKFGQISKNANIKADIATGKNLHGVASQYIAENSYSVASDTDITSTISSNVDGGIPKSKVDKTKSFVVTAKSNGDVIVSVKGTGDGATSEQVYPNPSSGTYHQD